MVEIFVKPLVGALCLIVFHIQAVMDSSAHCALQLGLQVVSSQNLTSNFIRARKSSSISSVRTFACHCVLNFSEFIHPVGWPTVERRVDVRMVITYFIHPVGGPTVERRMDVRLVMTFFIHPAGGPTVERRVDVRLVITY